MNMKLFALEIERDDGTVVGHIVAPTEKQAVFMVIDHDLARGMQHVGFTLERIDKKLPADKRRGLDHVLSGPAGFARYAEPEVGWGTDQVIELELFLFRFFTPAGENTYVIAGDENEAMAIYATSYTLAEGEHRLFRFVDGLADLPLEQREGLHSILEFGPRGVATWHDECGWSVMPPA